MAEQTARNWSSGDIVTAANLKSIERGVSAMAEEYTPTTWANGNTVTAAGLNNIEQGIVNAGGGGGSSDLSTATVTVINTVEDSRADLEGTFIDEQIDNLVSEEHCEYGTTTITVVLYKGSAIGYINAAEITSTTGNILLDYSDYNISGDCTVTVKGYSGGD